ncbi:hypothetical protein [Spongiibacter sp. UBA1325]|uniref:hypothetical protein n=1 Tax=Spongiibacter sp. UBA1325 TaxID=1947543 RepID=UPI00257FAE85|nr:hypothetical protein [Spongiibacter sp. UBA1325]|tara:strand:- start:490 stop:876 length:387 start_codon:yes stop_codon:yes gene_type:complete
MHESPIHNKILFIGVFLSALIWLIGAAYFSYQESKLRDQVNDCEMQSGGRFNGVPICSPLDLFLDEKESEPYIGIQAEIVSTQKVIWGIKEPVTLAVILVLSVSSIPWVWYFLLGRIRELSKAVRGKQ